MFPINREVLGLVLGPEKGEENEKDKWVLKDNENVVPRLVLISLNDVEIYSTVDMKKIDIFDP